MINHIKVFAGMAALGLVMSISLHLTAGEKYKIKDNTSVKWIGKKVTGEHYGSITLSSGTIELVGGKLNGGTFIMNMTSLRVEDLEGEWKDKLEGHLKSDDFFGVDKHKTASLKITTVSPNGANKYNVTGDMTIKGITVPLEFPVSIEMRNGELIAKGNMIIDRTKYDIKYGSGSFFDDLGDKMIEDNFELQFELTAFK